MILTKLNSLCGITCACCWETPDSTDSAWKCGYQAAGKTVQKPGKYQHTSGNLVGRDSTISIITSPTADITIISSLNVTLQGLGLFYMHERTCMAAVNWASFSIVSSESPLWTLVKTEVLKKYLQFWWSIWYSNSNISALMSGEDRCQTNQRFIHSYFSKVQYV